MKPTSIVFKGMVRGTYSEMQPVFEEINELPVMTFKGESLHEVLSGLAIDEWVFILKVNGKRIKNVFEYIKRKGLHPENYTRYQNGEWMV